jgi:two-component system response regulator NreC
MEIGPFRQPATPDRTWHCWISRSLGLAAWVGEEIARCCPDTRVLVLSMHDDPAYLRSVLAAGASGYVLKRAVDTELLTAIRAVHRGGVFVDPSLAHVFVQDALDKTAKEGTAPRALNILSERERQVLGLVAQGYGSQEIAKQILVSVKTVETYRARIAEKLGLRTRNEIVRFAVQMGLLTVDTLASVPRQSS